MRSLPSRLHALETTSGNGDRCLKHMIQPMLPARAPSGCAARAVATSERFDDRSHNRHGSRRRTVTLNGRIRKLEGPYLPHMAPGCASCGLRHVQPLTLGMVRRIIGPRASNPDSEGWRAQYPPRPLCLCACCAADSRN